MGDTNIDLHQSRFCIQDCDGLHWVPWPAAQVLSQTAMRNQNFFWSDEIERIAARPRG
jgi:hypothetical protein